MKTRGKITLMLGSIFFSLILVFSVFIYVFISRYSFMDFYKRLETRSISTAKAELETKTDTRWVKKFKSEYLQRLPEEKNYILELKKGLSLDFLARRNKLNSDLLLEIQTKKIGTYRSNNILYCGILYETDGKEFIVITSAKNYYFNQYMAYLRNLLLISVVASAVLIALISYWVSKRLIQPIKTITNRVNKIGTENLNFRLDGSEQDDELGELVRTFNNMLDRLETSFETQNNFISNASHELNTPLTSIIGEADVALARLRTVDEYIESLHAILEEAEKLDKKTKALLYLAQTGFNGKAMKFDKVRVDQLLLDVHETINRIYPKNKVQLDFSNLPDAPEKLKVSGNQQLLHLAISNVILNACKYSNNQEVQVSLTNQDDHVVVFVKDSGIGIPSEELQYIYDPFYRASNTSNFEGYGIGLPLTRNIIKLHKGELLVESMNQQGTTVLIRMPVGKFSY